MNIIDLSHNLINKGPTYRSDPELSIIKEKDLEENRSMLHSISFGTHTGTHIDVPAHMIRGGKTLDEFSLDSFMGIAVKVNNNNYKSLIDFNKNYDTVIYDTKWYRNYNEPDIFFGNNRPIIPENLISILIKKEIKIFGCDLPSVDVSGNKDKIVHNSFLKQNIILYESLTNLQSLPILTPFQFIGLPLPLVGLDGSPTRAIGIINN